MDDKIRPRLSLTIFAPQEKTEYVLEDVFWVPVNNCSSRSTTDFASEPLSKKPTTAQQQVRDDLSGRGEP
jgi:hypothetical protein